MKKQKETEQLFKDKQTEHRVVAAVLTGLFLYFGYQALEYFFGR